MATVINEVTVEPKAAPPPEQSSPGDRGSEGGKVPPDMQREIERLNRRAKERGARLRAY